MTIVTLPLPGQTAFTDTEARLIALLAEDLPTAEIGRRTYYAESTAQRHVRALKAKTGADDRTRIVEVALRTSATPLVAALQVLANRIAIAHGDIPHVTAARQADLLADLDRWQADRGTPYQPGRRRPKPADMSRDNDPAWTPSTVLAGTR